MQRFPAELKLHNGPTVITIRPHPASGRDPIMCKSWDLGAPEVRYTSTPNPGADGVTISAGFLGSRTVVLDLQILGDDRHDPYWYAAVLTQMAHPAAAPMLTVHRYGNTPTNTPVTDDDKWRMYLRGSPYSLVYTQRSAAVIDLQLTFLCPSGMLESGWRQHELVDTIEDAGARTDWIFSAVFPKGFGLVGATYPNRTITIEGDAAVTPTIYIVGPVTDPEIESDGDRFKFDGLTLAEGHTVGIDMGSGNIWLSDAVGGPIIDSMTAYGAVDWGVSTYWTWNPGPHHINLLSTTGSVIVQYRERRFTI